MSSMGIKVTKSIDAKIHDIIQSHTDHAALLDQYYYYLLNSVNGKGQQLRKTYIRFLLNAARKLLLDHDIQDYHEITPEKIMSSVLQIEKTRVDKLSQLKKFAFFLAEHDYIDSKTYKKIKKLKVKNITVPLVLIEPKHKKKWSLPRSRWDEVYDQLNTNSKMFVAWIGFNFGLREGEIAHLRVDQSIVLTHDPAKKGKLIIKPDPLAEWVPKTPASYRIIPISYEQSRIFENFLKTRKEFLQREFPAINHPYIIFSRFDGWNVKERTIIAWMSEVTLEFESDQGNYEKGLRPHVLRYTFATELYFKTRRIYEVSKLLGHSSIAQTEKYLSLGQEELFNNMAEVMEMAGF